MIIDIQEKYEDILSSHWQKLYQLKELVETNKNNSPLRLKSISDRQRELDRIIEQMHYITSLFSDILIVPNWYEEKIKDFK